MTKPIFTTQWEIASSAEKKKLLEQELCGLRPVVVCIDDDPHALEALKLITEKFGLEVFTIIDSESSLDFISKNKARILFVMADMNMPKMNGFELGSKIHEAVGAIPYIIVSGFVTDKMKSEAPDHHVASVFDKPLAPENLLNFLKKEIEPRLEVLKEEYEMLKGFTDDASNLLDNIEELCLELENNQHNQDAIARIFGMVHTIKGSSGFFEPRDLHTFSHAFEDLLKDVQSGKRTVTPPVVSVFLKANDHLKVFVDEFKTGIHQEYNVPEMIKMFKNIPESIEKAPEQQNVIESQVEMNGQAKEQKASELRVSMTLLNEFMQISGEMTVIRNMINKTVRNLEKQYQGDKEIGLLGELLDEMHKINSDVQGKITDIRRVPVSSLVKPLSRTVRDTARALSKEVDFIVEGEELRLDNSIAEVLSKSLVHMMRNSIDHGIESPQKRTQAGKNGKGKLFLKFSAQGENIFVDIQDDGAGINIEKIREKVVSKGLRSPSDAQKMSADELNYMIFDSGFSTAEQVTDFSGRGVGMSMVKDSVESLKGRIHIESEQGKGSKFRLEIPIPKSVLITNCLFVEVGERSYGIPQDHILKVMDKINLTPADYTVLEGAEVMRYNGNLIPICSLSKLMGVCGREKLENLIVIMNSEDSVFALRVESVQDIEDAVIKPLSFDLLKNIGIYLGGTFLADGSVGLVFNIEGIAKKIGIINHHYTRSRKALEQKVSVSHEESRNVILFNLKRKGQFCVEEKDVLRIEKVNGAQLQSAGDSFVIPYRDSIITFIDLEGVLSRNKQGQQILQAGSDSISTIIIKNEEQYLGLVVNEILDLKTSFGPLEKNMKKQFGIDGCFMIDEQVVSLISLVDILETQCSDRSSGNEQEGLFAA
jgi:two-component system chemotaxis sensor kinase CheA